MVPVGRAALASVQGARVLSRAGQIWEDQVGRILLVLGESKERNGDARHHACLRLSAGGLSGTVVEIPEFDDIPWEDIWDRLA